jgi:hypothetical protein
MKIPKLHFPLSGGSAFAPVPADKVPTSASATAIAVLSATGHCAS